MHTLSSLLFAADYFNYLELAVIEHDATISGADTSLHMCRLCDTGSTHPLLFHYEH